MPLLLQIVFLEVSTICAKMDNFLKISHNHHDYTGLYTQLVIRVHTYLH